MGFEPTTRGLKGRCSNLLSYGPAMRAVCWKQINFLHYADFGPKVNLLTLVFVLLVVLVVLGTTAP